MKRKPKTKAWRVVLLLKDTPDRTEKFFTKKQIREIFSSNSLNLQAGMSRRIISVEVLGGR